MPHAAPLYEASLGAFQQLGLSLLTSQTFFRTPTFLSLQFNRVYFSFRKTTLRYVSPSRDLQISLVINVYFHKYLLPCLLFCLLGMGREI